MSRVGNKGESGCVSVFMSVCACLYVRACAQVCPCVCVSVTVCACVCVHIRMCVCVGGTTYSRSYRQKGGLTCYILIFEASYYKASSEDKYRECNDQRYARPPTHLLLGPLLPGVHRIALVLYVAGSRTVNQCGCPSPSPLSSTITAVMVEEGGVDNRARY